MQKVKKPRLMPVLVLSLLLALCAGGCQPEVRMESLLENTRSLPGIRSNMQAELALATSSRELLCTYTGVLETAGNRCFLSGESTLESEPGEKKTYYMEYAPEGEGILTTYFYEKENDLWIKDAYAGEDLLSLAGLLDALQSPRLEKADKAAGTVNITGTLPFSAVNRFCKFRFNGRAFQTAVHFLGKTEYPLQTTLTFSLQTELPVRLSFVSQTAQELTPQYKLLSLCLQMDITDPTFSQIDIPADALQDAR